MARRCSNSKSCIPREWEDRCNLSLGPEAAREQKPLNQEGREKAIRRGKGAKLYEKLWRRSMSAENAFPFFVAPARIVRIRKPEPFRNSGFLLIRPTRSGRFGFRLPQATGVTGGDDLAADAPVPVFHFVNFHERVGTERFAFDRDHDFAYFLDHLLLLLRREHVFDYFNVYEWHIVSF
jgi:hypothetical protein